MMKWLSMGLVAVFCSTIGSSSHAAKIARQEMSLQRPPPRFSISKMAQLHGHLDLINEKFLAKEDGFVLLNIEQEQGGQILYITYITSNKKFRFSQAQSARMRKMFLSQCHLVKTELSQGLSVAASYIADNDATFLYLDDENCHHIFK